MIDVALTKDFWHAPKVRALPPKEKLVLAYVKIAQANNENIIIEDVATATGLEISECVGWLRHLIAINHLYESDILDWERV